MYRLALLGGVALEGPEGPLTGYATQSRQLALLALLGAAGEAGVSRDKLCASLWPESSEVSARHCLTDAVYRLRKALGREVILGRSVKLRLNPDVIHCDVWAFVAAVAAGDLETAAALYRGPFLDGFHLRESSELEHWKDGEARRLASMVEGVLEALATRAEEAGDPAGAVGWWRRLAAHDPFNSRTVVRLMEAEARAGDPANAVLYGREHAELIRRELGVEPPEELTELMDALSGASTGDEPEWTRPAVPKVPRLPVATPRVGRGKAATRGRRWWTVVVPVGLVAVGMALWLGWGSSVTPAGPTGGAAEEPERLVVLPLEVLTPDEDLEVWGQLAAEWAGHAIDRAGSIVVLPVDAVRNAVRSLGPDASAESVAGRLRTSHAMAGTVACTDDRVRFQVELILASTGERLAATEPVVGAIDSVEAVVGRLAEAAAAAVVASLDRGGHPWGGGERTPPARVGAYREYLRAVDLYCQLRYEDAIEAGDRALMADPGYLSALLKNGAAYASLSRFGEADSVFLELLPLRDRMTTAERLQHDYWVAYLNGDAKGAARAAEESYRMAPTANGYVAGLEMSQQMRHEEALTRFLTQDLDAACGFDWPGWWMSTTTAYHLLGRYDEELELVRRGLKHLPQEPGLMATEGGALAAMGRVDAVDSLLDAMAVLPFQSGFTFSTDRRIIEVGLELRAHGYPEAAEGAFLRALDGLSAQQPDQNRPIRGMAFYLLGRLADADTLAAALVKEDPGYIWARGFRAMTLARLGRRAEALEIDRWMASVPERPGLRGWNRAWRAEIAAILGDRDAAVRHYQDALDHRYTYGLEVHRLPRYDSMWGYPPWEALLAPR